MTSLIRLVTWLILAAALYLAAYFAVMEKGTALNRKTFLPEYPSVSRFSDSERGFGPVSIKVTFSSWLNPVFSPLDRIFR